MSKEEQSRHARAIDEMCSMVDGSPFVQDIVAGREELMVLIAEILEGHRMHVMDDVLSSHRMLELELANALVRICALAGRLKLNLGRAFVAQLEYQNGSYGKRLQPPVPPPAASTGA